MIGDWNTVAGNRIGTNAAGTAALPNDGNGIWIRSGSFNTIGGMYPGDANVISGNTLNGIHITRYNTTASPSISNHILGNYIGTNVDRSAVVSNLENGVLINGESRGTVIGGSLDTGNVISGNQNDGVNIGGGGGAFDQNLAPETLLAGNIIGTNASGAAGLGNGDTGVHIVDSDQVTLGLPGAGNTISGNYGRGVSATSNSKFAGLVVQGNRIGTDPTGTARLPNDDDGLFIVRAASAVIGGPDAEEGNVISASGKAGVVLSASEQFLFQGNYVGSDVTGTLDFGNAFEGVWLENSGNGQVVDNLISGNGDAGLRLFDENTFNVIVQRNLIGVQSDGASPLANDSHGVLVQNNASANTIGGLSDGDGNVIAFNGGDGVFVESGVGNAILRNSIHDNAELGIDLFPNGVNLNGAETVANNGQSYPVLTSVKIDNRAHR